MDRYMFGLLVGLGFLGTPRSQFIRSDLRFRSWPISFTHISYVIFVYYKSQGFSFRTFSSNASRSLAAFPSRREM